LFQYVAGILLSPKLTFHWILLPPVCARESCWQDFVDSTKPPVVNASSGPEHRRLRLDPRMMEEKITVLRLQDVFIDVSTTV
jgi:hypothetical protein